MGRTTIIRNDVAARPIKHVEKLWFTRKDAADYLGVSVDTIKTWNEEGKLRYAKTGKLVFVAKSDLDKYIKSCLVWGRGSV